MLRDNRALREERAILSKAGLVRTGDREDPGRIFQFMSVHRAEHRVATMCRVLEVPADVVDLTVFLTSMSDHCGFNEVLQSLLYVSLQARTTVGVQQLQLPDPALYIDRVSAGAGGWMCRTWRRE